MQSTFELLCSQFILNYSFWFLVSFLLTVLFKNMSSSYNQGRKTLDACFHKFFQVSNLYGVKGGRTVRTYLKGCTVSWGAQKKQKIMNTALLSQGLLSMIVVETSGCNSKRSRVFLGRLCGVWLPLEEIQEEFNKIFMAIKTGWSSLLKRIVTAFLLYKWN